LKEKPYSGLLDKILEFFRSRSEAIALRGAILTNSKIRTTEFKTESFEDFVWRTLFSKTLPASDFQTVVKKNYQVLSTSWHGLHKAGLSTLSWWFHAVFPRLDLGDTDIFIGQTPYPARVSKQTKLVIRYHDAIPVFLPHTINDVAEHQASHLFALEGNVKSGAWFSCVSEATRQELIKLHPEVEDRAVTIHNIVSPHYFKEETSFERVKGIIRSRISNDENAKAKGVAQKFLTLREQEGFFKKHISEKEFKYLLVVSTIEPRKNHARALGAWEILKEEVDPNLKLVLVGSLGWGVQSLAQSLKAWIDRGELFMLSEVPAPDLRVLYRHAAVTVCPSVSEGFDFSGIESMRSGGVTVSSDIPVHREIYEDASLYFDPYSTKSTTECLKRILYDSDSPSIRTHLQERGEEISKRYLPEKILPQWDKFLKRIVKKNN
jgi:hypothetical protein